MAKFYRCKSCGNLIAGIKMGACTPKCCGETMEELVANTTDGAKEKHVPAVTVDGDTVKIVVGEVEHPMLEKHYIQMIALEGSNTIQIKELNPGEAPKAEFAVGEDKPVAAYEFCNLHGLWKADV